MALPNTLLLTYQAEYETTPGLTIDQLCENYHVTKAQLKNHKAWTKREQPIDNIDNIDNNIVIDTSKTKKTTMLGKIANSNIDIQAKQGQPVDRAQLLEDIDNFKALAIAHAVKFMRNDAEFAEVKEFKDMVAIVDSIEKSYKDTKDPQGTNITIAIQNLVGRFKDDC